MQATSDPTLVLASSSPYRQQLLSRLGIPFVAATPAVDESPQPGEAADDLALRLSHAKARAVKSRFPAALIIGSDQVATVGGAILNKPGTRERAAAQLHLMSGRAVRFVTGLCLLNAGTGRMQDGLVYVTVHMRDLSEGEIYRYLDAEQPYDCAGSARIEALGITLVSRLEGDDPNALIGLPLIRLCEMLRGEGVQLP